MTPKGRRNAAVLFAVLVGLSIILFNRSEASTLQTVYARSLVLVDPEGRSRIYLGFDDITGDAFMTLTSEDGTEIAHMTNWFMQWQDNGKVIRKTCEVVR